jgi:hypothetical protein
MINIKMLVNPNTTIKAKIDDSKKHDILLDFIKGNSLAYKYMATSLKILVKNEKKF